MTQGGSPDTQDGSSTTHPADLKDVPGGRDLFENSPHIVVLVGLDGTECVVSRHQCAWDAQYACNRMAIRAASAQIPGMWEVRQDVSRMALLVASRLADADPSQEAGGRQQRYRTWEVRQEGIGGRVLAGPVPRGVEWPEPTSLTADKTVLRGLDGPVENEHRLVSELRELLSAFLDASARRGHVVTPAQWSRACLLCGRMCREYDYFVPPCVKRSPRYDEVFHRGTAWLDSLADEDEND
jgi:hypothetical protein